MLTPTMRCATDGDRPEDSEAQSDPAEGAVGQSLPGPPVLARPGWLQYLVDGLGQVLLGSDRHGLPTSPYTPLAARVPPTRDPDRSPLGGQLVSRNSPTTALCRLRLADASQLWARCVTVGDSMNAY
jgi:hypothetical protein